MTPTYHKGPRNFGTGYDMMARIEELEAACWRMKEERDRAIAWRDSDKGRADKAEAKLEKAVLALEKLARLGNGDRYGNSDGNMIARATLAELKGQEDE